MAKLSDLILQERKTIRCICTKGRAAEYDTDKIRLSNPCVRACEPEYVTGKPMVSEKEKRAAVS